MQRHRHLNHHSYQQGLIVYWMMRDHRAEDNWALVYAQQYALKHGVPLIVVLTFRADLHHHHVTDRTKAFMIGGIKQMAATLKQKNISCVVLLGHPVEQIQAFVHKVDAGMIVTDMTPVRPLRQWTQVVARSLSIPVHQVDTHNIIPVWEASPKKEYAAYTFRPKVHSKLAKYLVDIPSLKRMPSSIGQHDLSALDKIKAQPTPYPNTFTPGQVEASNTLNHFIKTKLQSYHKRNDPNESVVSELSPYLHFGHIAPQRVALQVANAQHIPTQAKEMFLEELIVRRELADNFCFYQPDYHSIAAFPDWAKQTLTKHQTDPRPFVYDLDQFKRAATHQPLWNAAQWQLLKTGKMHGYMRMYWAKKILEWSSDPQTAMDIAISLNDTFSLDGRDPNGYAGVAWSIGGVHDRPWFERAIFGKVRYMNAAGCARKFDTKSYIARWTQTTPFQNQDHSHVV